MTRADHQSRIGSVCKAMGLLSLVILLLVLNVALISAEIVFTNPTNQTTINTSSLPTNVLVSWTANTTDVTGYVLDAANVSDFSNIVVHETPSGLSQNISLNAGSYWINVSSLFANGTVKEMSGVLELTVIDASGGSNSSNSSGNSSNGSSKYTVIDVSVPNPVYNVLDSVVITLDVNELGDYDLEVINEGTVIDQFTVTMTQLSKNLAYVPPVPGNFTINVSTNASWNYTEFDVNSPDPIVVAITHGTALARSPTSFDSTITGGIAPYTYVWNFSTGSTSNLADPEHIFLEPKVYLVTLDVTDSQGNKGHGNVSVPVAQVSYELTLSIKDEHGTALEGLNVNLTDNVTVNSGVSNVNGFVIFQQLYGNFTYTIGNSSALYVNESIEVADTILHPIIINMSQYRPLNGTNQSNSSSNNTGNATTNSTSNTTSNSTVNASNATTLANASTELAAAGAVDTSTLENQTAELLSLAEGETDEIAIQEQDNETRDRMVKFNTYRDEKLKRITAIVDGLKLAPAKQEYVQRLHLLSRLEEARAEIKREEGPDATHLDNIIAKLPSNVRVAQSTEEKVRIDSDSIESAIEKFMDATYVEDEERKGLAKKISRASDGVIFNVTSTIIEVVLEDGTKEIYTFFKRSLAQNYTLYDEYKFVEAIPDYVAGGIENVFYHKDVTVIRDDPIVSYPYTEINYHILGRADADAIALFIIPEGDINNMAAITGMFTGPGAKVGGFLTIILIGCIIAGLMGGTAVLRLANRKNDGAFQDFVTITHTVVDFFHQGQHEQAIEFVPEVLTIYNTLDPLYQKQLTDVVNFIRQQRDVHTINLLAQDVYRISETNDVTQMSQAYEKVQEAFNKMHDESRQSVQEIMDKLNLHVDMKLKDIG